AHRGAPVPRHRAVARDRPGPGDPGHDPIVQPPRRRPSGRARSPSRSMTAVLDVRAVSVSIRLPGDRMVHAVDQVSLRVEPSEIVAVVGESGCGKTMLAMSVLGLLPAGAEITSGEGRFGDEGPRRVSSARMRDIRGREIGTIFQEPMSSLNPV